MREQFDEPIDPNIASPQKLLACRNVQTRVTISRPRITVPDAPILCLHGFREREDESRL